MIKTPRSQNVSLAYSKEYALNAICPYFTMFPLEYPVGILHKYKKAKPVILDPFCGRGTTLFAARKFGLTAWGIDSSPVAVAIAQAKLATSDTESTIQLARELIAKTEPVDIPDSDFFREAFHPETLREICALREGLLAFTEDNDASVLLRAASLGCLHGPLAKDTQQSGYFSNQMPRTYASKPDYAVHFWRKNGLQAPWIEVINVLRRKLVRLADSQCKTDNSFSQVLRGDSQLPDSFDQIEADPSIVITSPPYYGMRTYVQDQWLRNWFLGGPSQIDYGSGIQLDHGGKATFAHSLGKVWENIGRSSADDLRMYVRFGIIPSAKVNAKEIFRNSLEASGIKWRLVSVRKAHSAHAGKRQADQMKATSTAAIEFDFHVQRI